MRAHALRTAMTLYESGTVDLSGAARAAGLSASQMRHCLRSNGVHLREQAAAESPRASSAATALR
jgi:predicted HTH domain antitoxin